MMYLLPVIIKGILMSLELIAVNITSVHFTILVSVNCNIIVLG
jgi:hypothetical protein